MDNVKEKHNETYYAILTNDKTQILADARRVDAILSDKPVYKLYNVEDLLNNISGRYWALRRDKYDAEIRLKEYLDSLLDTDLTHINIDLGIYEINVFSYTQCTILGG